MVRNFLGFFVRVMARGVGLIVLVIWIIGTLPLMVAIFVSLHKVGPTIKSLTFRLLNTCFSYVIGSLYKFYTYGQRLSIVRGTVASETDFRSPVLLLRSFADDKTPVLNSDPIIATEWILGGRKIRTFEEALAEKLCSYGPVIAIGRPGETVPPLGASRMWVNHTDWQTRVEGLLSDCQLVVMIVGVLKGKDGLAWEVCRLLRLDQRQKVVFVVPPLDEDVVGHRWAVYHELSNGLIPPYQGGEVAARLSAEGVCKVVRFGSRQDGDYLVALGDLLGPPPGPTAYRRPGGTLGAWVRDMFSLLTSPDDFERDAYRVDDHWLKWRNRPRLPRRSTWIERLMNQVGIHRLVLDIRQDEFAREDLARTRHELNQIEERLKWCQESRSSAPEDYSEVVLAERPLLVERLDEIRSHIRSRSQPQNS
jgi:hypothetical protein